MRPKAEPLGSTGDPLDELRPLLAVASHQIESIRNPATPLSQVVASDPLGSETTRLPLRRWAHDPKLAKLVNDVLARGVAPAR